LHYHSQQLRRLQQPANAGQQHAGNLTSVTSRNAVQQHVGKSQHHSLKISPPVGIWTPSNKWFLGSTQIYIQNGISSVRLFLQGSHFETTPTQTDVQTMLRVSHQKSHIQQRTNRCNNTYTLFYTTSYFWLKCLVNSSLICFHGALVLTAPRWSKCVAAARNPSLRSSFTNVDILQQNVNEIPLYHDTTC